MELLSDYRGLNDSGFHTGSIRQTLLSFYIEGIAVAATPASSAFIHFGII